MSTTPTPTPLDLDALAALDEGRANAEFIAAARTALPELIAEVRRLRAQLRDAHNDLLDMRGILSPNGSAPVTPVPLVPTVAPAVAWLVAEVERLRAELRQARATIEAFRETHGSAAMLADNLAAVRLERDEAEAEVQQLLPVVEAAQAWYANGAFPERYGAELSAAVEAYEADDVRFGGVR